MDLIDYRVFQGLNRAQLDDFVSACTEQTFAASTEMITRGSRGTSMYFLLEGELRVFLPGTQNGDLALLTAPAVVGEMEFLTGLPRSASVSASKDAKVLAVSFEVLRRRIEDGDPAVLRIMFNVAAVLALRLSATVTKLVEMEDASNTSREDLHAFRQKLFSDWSF